MSIVQAVNNGEDIKMSNNNEEDEFDSDIIELEDDEFDSDVIALEDDESVTEHSSSDGSERIEIALQTLTTKEQAVIRYRYGLDDDVVNDNKDVADKFGISEVRVKQIVYKFRRAYKVVIQRQRRRQLRELLDLMEDDEE